SRSVTLPLPSSPHWAPIRTIAGMSITPGCQATRGWALMRAREADGVRQVVLLSLTDGCLGAPVLACRDALVAERAGVATAAPGSDAELDEIITRLDGPRRADGLAWPAAEG